MDEKIRLLICGAGGRMGSLIIQLASGEKKFIIAGAVEQKGHPLVRKEIEPNLIISDDLQKLSTGKEVIIDFTTPDSTLEFLKVAVQKKNSFVIGTTGFSGEQMGIIKKSAKEIPILLSPNMSLGVNCFFEIIRSAAKLLKEYEIEILETHHHLKKDAPSGTAKKMADIICDVLKRDTEQVLKFGRNGFTGKRKQDEIGMHSLRIGDIVGEHTVFFGGKGEIIEISHRCYNREIFASGALKAAQFIYKRPPGFYTMKDVIKTVMSVEC